MLIDSPAKVMALRFTLCVSTEEFSELSGLEVKTIRKLEKPRARFALWQTQALTGLYYELSDHSPELMKFFESINYPRARRFWTTAFTSAPRWKRPQCSECSSRDVTTSKHKRVNYYLLHCSSCGHDTLTKQRIAARYHELSTHHTIDIYNPIWYDRFKR
ncbi:hypothetical protein [Vibrio mediterranei]|uniref:hypothetical protein n=1 Tax=Vibrio mediterranei TaxID=689 RepID=UPI0040686CB0